MKSRLKNKVLAGIGAAVLAMSMAPGLAFAETGSAYTSDITVNGVKAGDTVTAYELVDSVVGSDNNKTTESKPDGLSLIRQRPRHLCGESLRREPGGSRQGHQGRYRELPRP